MGCWVCSPADRMQWSATAGPYGSALFKAPAQAKQLSCQLSTAGQLAFPCLHTQILETTMCKVNASLVADGNLPSACSFNAPRLDRAYDKHRQRMMYA